MGSLLPQSKKGKRRCIACVVGGIFLAILGAIILAVVAYVVVYCQLKDIESEEGLGAPNFYMGCKGKESSSCSSYFSYGYSGRKKDGSSCCSSQDNYLCEYPSVTSLPAATPANQIKVMTWNIYERPMFLGREGQRERTCRIPRWIFDNVPDVDVICFQELHLGGCWGELSSMKEMLKHHGFMYMTETVASGDVINGGGVIASRWPIEVEKDEEFNRKSIASHLFPKGMNYAKIRKTSGSVDKVYHVFNAHFESSKGSTGDTIREDQAVELRTMIEGQNIPSTEPVIVAGDFNIDYYTQTSHFNKVFTDTLKGVLPTDNAVLQYTHDTQVSALLLSKEDGSTVQEWLDYVMYVSDYEAPTSSSFNILDGKWTAPMRMCWDVDQLNIGAYRFPDSDECHDTEEFSDLSDHLPLVAQFTFA